MSKQYFSKEDSSVVKGAALLMMLWHHCFLAGRFEAYSLSFWPLMEYQVTGISSFFKICVSLFAFISGYGLYLSYQKWDQAGNTSNSRWLAGRWRSTLSGYWFVVILSWIVCMVIDQRPIQIYGFDDSLIRGAWNALVDFLGLSNFFGSPILNGTWWYMSAAVVFILVTPLLFRGLNRLGTLCTLGIILVLPRLWGGYPGGSSWLSFLPAYCMGMVFARHDLFGKWGAFWEGRCTTALSRGVKLAGFLVVLAVLYKLYRTMSTSLYWDIKWGLIPVAVLLFIRDHLTKLPLVSRVLAFIGKHSMNIFLTHTFIRQYYCTDFVYSLGHMAVVILVLLGISVVMSLLIEWLKGILRYEQLVDRLMKKNG